MDKDALQGILGPPVDISGIAAETKINNLDALIFELYKEAITVLSVTSSILDESSAAKSGFPRNQAICAGLLVRIAKLMIVIAQLSGKDDRGEVVMLLNRSIMESAINLEFLVRTAEDKYFDQFVEFSLGPERELYDTIQTNIAARKGELLPIEQRMLKSIDNLCVVSSVRIQDVARKHRDWGDNLKERLKTLNKEQQYVIMQRIPSHAVHGTWVDLYMRHLKYDDKTERFTPNLGWSAVDARLLGPIAVFVLDAAEPYIERFLSTIPESKLLLGRIDNLRNRLLQADTAHETLMNAPEV